MLTNSIQTVLVILILIGIGWFMSLKGWLLKEHKPFLIKLIINISVPAVTINNFFNSFPREMLFTSSIMFLLPFMTMLICYVLANIMVKVLKVKDLRRGSFIAMCTVSNSIFIGLPVCQGLFGDVSTPYVMFYYIVNTIIFWGLCSPKIRQDGEGKASGVKESIKKIFTVPLITVFVCSILLLVGYKPPALILKTTKYLASMATPLSLILVGKLIHEIGFRNIKLDKSLVAVILMRFLIAPIITFSMSKVVGIVDIATQVFTIQAAMPIMIQTTVVAEAYNVDSKYVASAVSITTIASIIFVPIYMQIMQHLL